MLPADLDAQIRRARLPGLIRAIAAAENKAAVARARKLPAAAHDDEAQALRADLERLVAGGEDAGALLTPRELGGKDPSAQPAADRVPAPSGPSSMPRASGDVEDAGPAAEQAVLHLQQRAAALTEVRHLAARDTGRPSLPRRALRVGPDASLPITPMRSVGAPRASPLREARAPAP